MKKAVEAARAGLGEVVRTMVESGGAVSADEEDGDEEDGRALAFLDVVAGSTGLCVK